MLDNHLNQTTTTDPVIAALDLLVESAHQLREAVESSRDDVSPRSNSRRISIRSASSGETIPGDPLITTQPPIVAGSRWRSDVEIKEAHEVGCPCDADELEVEIITACEACKCKRKRGAREPVI